MWKLRWINIFYDHGWLSHQVTDRSSKFFIVRIYNANNLMMRRTTRWTWMRIPIIGGSSYRRQAPKATIWNKMALARPRDALQHVLFHRHQHHQNQHQHYKFQLFRIIFVAWWHGQTEIFEGRERVLVRLWGAWGVYVKKLWWGSVSSCRSQQKKGFDNFLHRRFYIHSIKYGTYKI